MASRSDLDAPQAAGSPLATERMARWREAVGDGLDAALARQGIARRQALAALGEDARTLPAPGDWAGTLAHILATPAPRAQHGDRSLRAADPVPFEELLLCFVAHAREQALARAGASAAGLDDAAWADLERALLVALSETAALSFGVEFRAFAALRDPVAAFLGRAPGSPDSRRVYLDFVAAQHDGGLRSLFEEYAVLGRLLVLQATRWAGHASRLCLRLAEDRDAITAGLLGGRDPGAALGVHAALSDPHDGGQSVVVLRFESGARLVYKPRDLAVEKGYASLCAWLNRAGAEPDFKVLRVIDRSSHGWVEHAAALPCADLEALDRYYLRAGMLLALLHVLEATDCHHENVIACGEHPLLVDAETLFSHRIRPWQADTDGSAEVIAGDRLADSVLRIGLLPQWHSLGPEAAVDVSGFGGASEQRAGVHEPAWEAVNSDAMRLVFRERIEQPRDNVPALGGRRQPASGFVDAIVRGFEAGCALLIAHRDDLLAPDGPLAAFAHEPVRFLFRGTGVYVQMLSRLRQPEFQREGVDRAIALDALSRPFVGGDGPRGLPWALWLAERRALEGLDIPIFHASTSGRDLLCGDEVVAAGVFEESGLERVRARLAGLDEAEVTLQAGYVRAAIAPAPARAHGDAVATRVDDAASAQRADTTATELVDEAVAIGDVIAGCAVRSPDGTATWIVPGFDEHTEVVNLEAMPAELYRGRCGTALFLAALEGVRGGAGYGELAVAALRAIGPALDGTAAVERVLRGSDVGGASGIGGIVYALARVGDLLGERSLHRCAQTLAATLTDRRLAADRRLDVVHGTAGALLGLLALHASTGSAPALERAKACGRRLLASRDAPASGPRSWRTVEGVAPLSGFSHGTAGIVYALARLHEVTGDARLLAAVREGMDYEATLFDRDHGNWRDLLFVGDAGADGALGFRASWCHGAPGIGLARVALPRACCGDAARADVETALETTSAVSWHGVDSMCCGNFGRLELMLEAGTRLARPALLDEARRRAGWLVARARAEGGYSLGYSGPGAMASPAFFQGLAGIGYQLLRVAAPGSLPAVLLWQ